MSLGLNTLDSDIHNRLIMNQIHIDKLAEKLEGALLERGDLSHEDCMQAGRALYDLVEENEIIV